MSLFLSNIPQANDNLDFSQGQLLSNNAGLDTVFAIDHTLFSDSTANKGFHKKVTLYQVASDPAQTFPSSLIYSKNVGSTPNRVTNLYFSSKPETGADVVKQLTGSIITESGNDGQGGTYNLFQTPWNFKIFTGQTASFSGSRTFTLSGASNFGATIYTAQASAFGAGPISTSITPTTNAKTMNIQTSNSAPVYWIVITS